MDVGILLFFIVILLIGGVVLFFVSNRSRGGNVLNVDKFRSDWLTIDQSVVKDNEATYHMAILNADKLLDQALVAAAEQAGEDILEHGRGLPG